MKYADIRHNNLGSRNLQLEVDVARRLRLAAIAHAYPILPHYSL